MVGDPAVEFFVLAEFLLPSRCDPDGESAVNVLHPVGSGQ